MSFATSSQIRSTILGVYLVFLPFFAVLLLPSLESVSYTHLIGDKQLEAAAASFAVKLEKERDEENGLNLSQRVWKYAEELKDAMELGIDCLLYTSIRQRKAERPNTRPK